MKEIRGSLEGWKFWAFFTAMLVSLWFWDGAIARVVLSLGAVGASAFLMFRDVEIAVSVRRRGK